MLTIQRERERERDVCVCVCVVCVSVQVRPGASMSTLGMFRKKLAARYATLIVGLFYLHTRSLLPPYQVSLTREQLVAVHVCVCVRVHTHTHTHMYNNKLFTCPRACVSVDHTLWGSKRLHASAQLIRDPQLASERTEGGRWLGSRRLAAIALVLKKGVNRTGAHTYVYGSATGEGKTADKVKKVNIRLVDEDGSACTQWSMPLAIDEIRSVPLRLLHSSSNLADAVAQAPVLKSQRFYAEAAQGGGGTSLPPSILRSLVLAEDGPAAGARGWPIFGVPV